ncbi:unnamed protein product [Medioppia subpectinata]|uniref:Glycoside hydrolase family 5 domain-containing protein n=1 Tax=Medioppia subpectinata TaxID=1979941 RepID=A0A7R9KXE9_9ACAR|nr:unnamed protein product [Medioppia subpectinata]CAG2111639.1 unnamed protein product [Medioppia subpectinata]
MFKTLLLVSVLAYLCRGSEAYLTVKGREFHYNGQQVFLSGANIAWSSEDLGHDWGNGKYWEHRAKMREWLAGIHSHGGNVARVWLHFGGAISPEFDAQGYVVGTDKQNDLVKELQALMDDAQANNVFIILCMFTNSIYAKDSGFITDEKKIQSYLDKALVPMVQGLKGKKALAAWEIENEPEGAMDIWTKETDPHTCFDIYRWQKSNKNMGYESRHPIKRILRFFNWISSTIHTTDPSALVSVGTWNPKTSTGQCDHCFNLYQDQCLVAAGGKANGVLDFYQMHSYECGAEHPIKRTAEQYSLDKPLMVGEFSTKRSCMPDSAQVYKHYYFGGYAGCMAWQYNDHHDNDRDSRDVINHGMDSIRHETSNGVIDCAYSLPAQCSVTQFLGSIASDPAHDLLNDPCAKKSRDDAGKCLIQKIPDIDPHSTDPKYICCVTWVASDCLASAGKIDCTAAEFAALRKILDEITALGDAGACKAYPYHSGIQTCAK